MKKIGMVFIILVLLAGCADSNNELIDWDSRESDRTEQIIHALLAGEYAVVRANFNSGMKSEMSTRSLRRAWEDAISEAGAFVEIVHTEQLPDDFICIYRITTRHQEKGIVTRIIFDYDSGLITGFNIRTTETFERVGSAIGDEDPEVIVIPNTNLRITVGDETDFPLNGILSLPGEIEPDTRIPAVILVHGSGPRNRNSTMDGRYIFRDLADALPQAGIAVLRYDKRSYAHKEYINEMTDNNTLTVWHDTIQDVLLAKEVLNDHRIIDPDRVFIVGHELGAMLTPRIVSEGGFAGGVLLAGSSRSLVDIARERQHPQSEIDRLSHSFYIEEMDMYPLQLYITDALIPFLMLQGEADDQIFTQTDFAPLAQIAEERAHIQTGLYAGLGHFFTRADTTKMDAEVLKDIAAWLNTHSDEIYARNNPE
jgi:hypothetical protein